MESWEPSQHLLIDTGKTTKNLGTTFSTGISLVCRKKTQKFDRDNQGVADNQPCNLPKKTSKRLSLEPKISAVKNE